MFSTRRVPRCVTRRVVEAMEPRVMLAVTPISVDNASFEQVAGPDGQPIGVALWSISGSNGNAFNPTSASYTAADDGGANGGALPSPGDQKQVLFINFAASAGNTAVQGLNATAVAETIYELTVAVGNRGDLIMDFFQISLFAGEELIASGQGDGEAAAPNSGFADFTVTSPVISATSPGAGQPLRIELTNLGTRDPEFDFQVNFDNVRLNAITEDVDTTPPTASVTPPVVVQGSAFTDFDVLFADDTGLDTETIQAEDLVVNGPGGPVGVTLQDLPGTFGAPSTTATFRIAAPGGTWGSEDNGAYTIAINGAVFDTRGNRLAPVTTTFTVNFAVPDTQAPTAALVQPAAPALGATTYQFTVNYIDNVAIAPGAGNDN